ncbi:putative quinol monooxygenase [Providencia vermicola]|uniref:putative quinol monooxygenase n=1 Tax=Providencia vermicola TaxID=333965 RepID=UPI0034E50F95
MSIVVYAQITTENKDGYLTKDIIKNLAKLSRREQGCIKYDLFTKDDGYIVFEEWESADALEMHKKTAHFKLLVEAIERDNASISINFSENYQCKD